MEDASYWLPLIWAFLLGTAVALYIVLDGFDLGLGILFPFTDDEQRRDVMMNTVAPFWDGNETWLILGGGGLFVAFPKAYAIIMPAVYLPLIIMLLALVFRGVAFEFRWVSKPDHSPWDWAFIGGSITAAFMQGVILGALLQGINVQDGAFAGGTWDWLTPFSLFCGVAVVCGYALLGTTWLIMKTEGEIAAWARRLAMPFLLATLACMAVISLWTPMMLPHIAERWFAMPNFLLLSPVPILTALTAFGIWRGLEKDNDTTPFLFSIALFMLAYVGLVVSHVPYLIPPSLTVWDVAGHPSAQMFSLVGALIMLPIILIYTAFIYWTFRGKVRAGEGYH
jgi:cytochrome bd ubiquinol oxidase subunit II